MMSIVLSKDQQNVVDKSVTAFQNGERVIGIEGEGGTGKTTVIKTLIARLGINSALVLTAPTHDACDVLERHFDGEVSDYKVKTIYSFLGMRLTDDKEEISVVPAGEVNLGLVRCVVVDEVSMVGTSLYNRILLLIEKFPNVLWIFTGDSFQLKPVKDTKSKIFDLVREHTHFTLRENMRMKGGSPVLATVSEIRQCITDNYFGAIKFEKEIHEKGSLYPCSVPQFNTSFAKAVVSDKYSPTAIVALAYTNARVAQLNNIARTAVHGENPNNFYEGENILTAEAVKEGADIVVTKNTRGEITEILGLAMSPASYDLQYVEIECYVLLITFHGGKGEHILYHPTHKGMQVYEETLAELYKEAKKHPSKYNWFKYHSFRVSVASVRHTYAMTVHRSQGRDFTECVYVDAVNIFDKCFDRREIYHLLNVGLSRTRKDVIVSQRGG